MRANYRLLPFGSTDRLREKGWSKVSTVGGCLLYELTLRCDPCLGLTVLVKEVSSSRSWQPFLEDQEKAREMIVAPSERYLLVLIGLMQHTVERYSLAFISAYVELLLCLLMPIRILLSCTSNVYTSLHAYL